jgi:hypothetical protein
VIDNSPGINDSEAPDHRSHIDDRSCHNDGSLANLHIWGITAARMNKRDQLGACCRNQFAKYPTSRGITNGDNKPVRHYDLRDHLSYRPFG